jgi:hypothetical protein
MHFNGVCNEGLVGEAYLSVLSFWLYGYYPISIYTASN